MTDSCAASAVNVAIDPMGDNDSASSSQPLTSLAAVLAQLNQDHMSILASRRRLVNADDSASLDVNVGDAGSCQMSDVSSVASWQNDIASQDDDLSCSAAAAGITDDSDFDRDEYDDIEDDDETDARDSMILQRCIEAELMQRPADIGGDIMQPFEDLSRQLITAFSSETIKRVPRADLLGKDIQVSDASTSSCLSASENGYRNSSSSSQNSSSVCRAGRFYADEVLIDDRTYIKEDPVAVAGRENASLMNDCCASYPDLSPAKSPSISAISSKCHNSNVSRDKLRSVNVNGFAKNEGSPECRGGKAKMPGELTSCVSSNKKDFICSNNSDYHRDVESISCEAESSAIREHHSDKSVRVNRLTSLSVDTADDSLTDVPLDDGKKALSVEIDADSAADAASVVSEDLLKPAALTSGVAIMPSVEDGLSSSDISDVEEIVPNGAIDHCLSKLSGLNLPSAKAALENVSGSKQSITISNESESDSDLEELRQLDAAVADCTRRKAESMMLASPQASAVKAPLDFSQESTLSDRSPSSKKKHSDKESIDIDSTKSLALSSASEKMKDDGSQLSSNGTVPTNGRQQQQSQPPYEAERESFLIEGVLFRARYLGSTQLISEGQPSKAVRMLQAQEAINRVKQKASEQAPAGSTTQPSTLVDLFVSVEKIMVLNTDLQEIMMDHALRTISYIADIGDLLVVMARRGPVSALSPTGSSPPGQQGAFGNAATPTGSQNQTKICCHVFESDEAQLIAQSISQAFQVAYMEFLKANGINDPDLMKEMDYQDVLSQQAIFGEELFLFSNKEMQKEIIVPKLKNEPLGIVIVESGWGSMVPTIVLASMAPGGAAARCSQLNVGDQIMSVNGVSLVGLPLSTCQNYVKAVRSEILVRLMVVSCTPVVEVLVKRPDIKYQLGFSVQNGVICSLLRGGIAERGGVRVGHRIIEINGQSVVAVPHEKIVSMLATSVGEIHMKTMQTSVYRLLTGQDTPHYI